MSGDTTAERACIWREVLSNSELNKIGRHIHPKMWNSYVHHWRRSCEKSGTTHIAWIALPELDSTSIEPIENDLIESMNPTGNRRRTQPPELYREDTKQIFGTFRETINLQANRSQRFALELHKNWPMLGSI